MLVKLLLLGVCLSIALSLCGEVRHPVARPFFMTLAGFALAALCYLSVWLSFAAVLSAMFLATGYQSLRGLLPTIPALALAVMMVTQPGADDMLWLETKYPDTFLYIEDGLYYSQALQVNIEGDKFTGDNYQSVLYNDTIVKWARGSVPQDAEIIVLRVEDIQTNYLAKNMDDYVEKVHPEVVLYVKVPFGVTLKKSSLKYVTKLEVL